MNTQLPAIADLDTLLRHMQPALAPGCYAFCCLPEGVVLDPAQVVASIRESEGLSVVVSEQLAAELGLPVAMRVSWITLKVHSDLAAVGLTAAFSQALAQAGVACNVVAGVHHDHVFVPVEMTGPALAALAALSRATA